MSNEKESVCLAFMQVDVPLKEALIKAERLGDDATFLLTMEVEICKLIYHSTRRAFTLA